MRENCQSVETIFRLLFDELQKLTRASVENCHDIATRLSTEVERICTESKRIQASGDIEHCAIELAQHRLQQCLHYYRLGSRQGRVELHSVLSAIVYRYITPPQLQSSYQARLELIQDFVQNFYVESLNAFRRETHLPANYSPRTLLELSEYMAFTQRYAKRRISLGGGRTQQLIILRAQTFSQQQPQETSVDIEQAAESASHDSESTGNDSTLSRVREILLARASQPEGDSLRETVIKELMTYLHDRDQKDCRDYFSLRLQDLPTQEIEAILGISPRQRDYLQQRFKYHLLKFAFSHRWELVHEWLDADLDHNLGLTAEQWQIFLSKINSEQETLLRLKQQGLPDDAIAPTLGCTVAQLQKRWYKLLELAWELRNRPVSGSGALTDE